jgi:hypothetical protein
MMDSVRSTAMAGILGAGRAPDRRGGGAGQGPPLGLPLGPALQRAPGPRFGTRPWRPAVRPALRAGPGARRRGAPIRAGLRRPPMTTTRALR